MGRIELDLYMIPWVLVERWTPVEMSLCKEVVGATAGEELHLKKHTSGFVFNLRTDLA